MGFGRHEGGVMKYRSCVLCLVAALWLFCLFVALVVLPWMLRFVLHIAKRMADDLDTGLKNSAEMPKWLCEYLLLLLSGFVRLFA